MIIPHYFHRVSRGPSPAAPQPTPPTDTMSDQETAATPAAAPAEEAATKQKAPDDEPAKEGEEGKRPRGKGRDRDSDRDREETPIEELYDLSQPITHVPRPNKAEHEAETAALNSAIDELKAERQKLQDKIDGNIGAKGNPAAEAEKNALKALRASKGSLIDEKKALRARLDATRTKADKLMNEKKAARGGLRFSSLEDIQKEISKLQKEQETTSMSLAAEKKLLKEIETLQASKSMVAQVKSKDVAITDAKEERKVVSTAMGEKDKEIDAVQKEIDERSAALKIIFDKASGDREVTQKLFKERDALRKQVGDKIDERNKLRETFREDNNKWYNYQRAVRKQKQMKYEEDKKVREEEQKAWQKAKEQEELKKIPYEEEMALCDYLADYLSRTYLTDAEAEKKKKEEAAAAKKAADVIAVKDDPFANFKPVSKKTDDVFLQMGAGKKKRQRNKAAVKATNFTLSVDSFEQFGLLGLNPPTNLDAVEKAVADLKARKTWYSEQPRGSVKTAQEIRKENAKATAKIRGGGGSDENGGSSGSKKGSKKGFDASGEDFAPLGSGGASSAVNANWGQKATEEAAATEDPTPAAAAEE